MRRLARTAAFALALVAVGAVAAPPEPSTGGAMPFDALWEKVVLGAPPVVDARAIEMPGPVAMRGTFVESQGVLRLQTPAAVGESTWITPVVVEDGLVRARLLVGDKLDASVLVRAAVGPAGELVSGYAVSVEEDGGKATLELYRYEHQLPRALGAAAKLEGPMVKGSVLEVVVQLNGPFLDATVFDGATLKPRGRAFIRDRAFARGLLGVRFHRSQDTDSGLSLLSLGAGAHDLASSDDGAGPERLVRFPSDQSARLPADLRARVLEVKDGVAALVTDVLGLERAKRSGVIPQAVSSDMPWKFVDPSVRARIGKAPTKTAAGFRVDDGYKDADAVEALVRAYAARFPQITKLEEIGRSVEGRPILALKISRNAELDEDEDSVLLDGAHHGGELMSTEFALDAIQQLTERYKRDPQITALVDTFAIWVVPLVNPDGNMRFIHLSRDADRKNARDVDHDGVSSATDGVDLYRNYPVRHGALGEVGSRSLPQASKYRGEAPASEPEVQAMMALASRERFTASIDFHTNGTVILVPYTDPGMESPEPNEAWVVADDIAAVLPVQTNGKRYEVKRNMYPVDGTCQDWLRFSFGTVALLVEGPTHNPLPYSKGRPAAVVGTRPTWLTLFQRTKDGPGVVVHAKDADGAPLEAEVVIDEMKPKMGEVWTTRPRDGRMHRLLPSTGTYTIRVRAKGYAEKVRTITLDAPGTAVVDVRLDRAS
jgi:hypothetical protein